MLHYLVSVTLKREGDHRFVWRCQTEVENASQLGPFSAYPVNRYTFMEPGLENPLFHHIIRGSVTVRDAWTPYLGRRKEVDYLRRGMRCERCVRMQLCLTPFLDPSLSTHQLQITNVPRTLARSTIFLIQHTGA